MEFFTGCYFLVSLFNAVQPYFSESDPS